MLPPFTLSLRLTQLNQSKQLQSVLKNETTRTYFSKAEAGQIKARLSLFQCLINFQIGPPARMRAVDSYHWFEAGKACQRVLGLKLSLVVV